MLHLELNLWNFLMIFIIIMREWIERKPIILSLLLLHGNSKELFLAMRLIMNDERELWWCDYVVQTTYEWSDKREEVISVNRYFNFRFLNKVVKKVKRSWHEFNMRKWWGCFRGFRREFLLMSSHENNWVLKFYLENLIY